MNSASFFWSQWGQSLKFMQHHGTCMQPKAALCGHHAAVARILHAPGMIEVIDRVEEIKCLASDGSTDVHICLCHLEAYVRNLGPVNLFFTLSAANLHWQDPMCHMPFSAVAGRLSPKANQDCLWEPMSEPSYRHTVIPYLLPKSLFSFKSSR